jgi:hypothetical protein
LRPRGGIGTASVPTEFALPHESAEMVTKKCAALKQDGNLFEIRIPLIDDTPDTVVV